MPVAGSAMGWLARWQDRRAEHPSPGLLDAASDVVCQRDADGVVQFITPSAVSVLGTAPDQIVGTPLDSHLHPDDRLDALAALQRLLATGTTAALEIRWPLPSGGLVWLEMQSATLDGGARYATTLRDVTRRRLAETELRRMRDDLTGAIAAGPGVLYRLHRAAAAGQWRLAFISANVERLTGYAVASVMAAPAWPDGAMQTDAICRRWQGIEAAIDHGSAIVEYAMATLDGTERWVTDHLRRRDRADGTMEIVGYLQDVTEQRATERQLGLAREEVDTLTATGPGLLYRARRDADGGREIMFVADGADRILGVGAADILEPGWFAAQCDPAGLAGIADALLMLPPNGTTTVEFRIRDGAGAWRWLRDTVRAVRADGASMDLVGYWTDVTRERDLSRQLGEAAKLALLGEMATGMAHELKQPLGSIGLASEVAAMALQQKPADVETALRKLTRITEQTQRTAQLIDHMRVFGRRDDGPTGAIDLAAAVEGAAAIMSGRLRSKRVNLVCDLPSGLPPVHGQIVLLEQVLINLFANACDAYPSGNSGAPAARRDIEVTAELRGETLVAIVADHAGGIPDDIVNRVFEPFFTTKPPDQGTGLGLSISYGIVRDLGGNLSVRNSATGAVFELHLPINLPASRL